MEKIEKILMKIDERIYELDEAGENKRFEEWEYDELTGRRKGLREAWRIIKEIK